VASNALWAVALSGEGLTKPADDALLEVSETQQQQQQQKASAAAAAAAAVWPAATLAARWLVTH
jgi:membrane protease subunit (stomatin/prohibitin family)